MAAAVSPNPSSTVGIGTGRGNAFPIEGLGEIPPLKTFLSPLELSLKPRIFNKIEISPETKKVLMSGDTNFYKSAPKYLELYRETVPVYFLLTTPTSFSIHIGQNPSTDSLCVGFDVPPDFSLGEVLLAYAIFHKIYDRSGLNINDYKGRGKAFDALISASTTYDSNGGFAVGRDISNTFHDFIGENKIPFFPKGKDVEQLSTKAFFEDPYLSAALEDGPEISGRVSIFAGILRNWENYQE